MRRKRQTQPVPGQRSCLFCETLRHHFPKSLHLRLSCHFHESHHFSESPLTKVIIGCTSQNLTEIFVRNSEDCFPTSFDSWGPDDVWHFFGGASAFVFILGASGKKGFCPQCFFLSSIIFPVGKSLLSQPWQGMKSSPPSEAARSERAPSERAPAPKAALPKLNVGLSSLAKRRQK